MDAWVVNPTIHCDDRDEGPIAVFSTEQNAKDYMDSLIRGGYFVAHELEILTLPLNPEL